MCKESKPVIMIHKEGFKIIFFTGIALIAINSAICLFFPLNNPLVLIFSVLSVVTFMLVALFFRVPSRSAECSEKVIVAPADGKVVVIEKIFEKEYFNDLRTQVSIFMSPLNAHVNWSPVSGKVQYFKYHQGTYIVAWKPKASEENERLTTVIKTPCNSEILIRQIAGKVARRIVSYAYPEKQFNQGEQIGFIKFGSRVDIFLPVDAQLHIQLKQKVRGNRTVIAVLP